MIKMPISNILDYDLVNEKDTPLAKMDREILLKISKGLIPLESSTLDLLFHLSPYVDIDKKININMDQLCSEMDFRKSTFKFALNQAIQFGLIKLIDNDYYSEFHIVTTGEGGNYTYIPNLKILTTPLFKNYTLNQKRLFLYFLASRPPGLKNVVAIKNLYRNCFHSKDVGVNYFRSYREVVDTIIKMVGNGHICIEATKTVNNQEIKEYFRKSSNKDAETVKKDILNFFEIEETKEGQKGKKWVYKEDKLKLKISAHILHDARNGIRKVVASEQEIYNLCEQFEVPIYHLENAEAWRYIIAYKNELHREVGKKGITLYRESLLNFFKESAPLMQYYLQIDKVANYFMDFHLLKKCMNEIISFAKVVNTETTTTTTENLVKAHFKEVMIKLLAFINNHGSDLDLLVLQEELDFVDDKKLEDVFQSTWLDSKNKISAFVSQKYIEHVINRQLELTVDQYKTELLKVVYANRAKQNALLENRLDKLAYRMQDINKRLENRQIIENYMTQLHEIKKASMQGNLYKDVKPIFNQKQSIRPLQICQYNWLDNK